MFTNALMIDIRMSRDIDGRIGSKIPMYTHCTEGMTSFTFVDWLKDIHSALFVVPLKRGTSETVVFLESPFFTVLIQVRLYL